MNLLEQLISEKFAEGNILLLGFGREGQSSYTLLRTLFPDRRITIADRNEAIEEHYLVKADVNARFITGIDYLSHIGGFDIIMRSPGIPVWRITGTGPGMIPPERFTSQTDLFLAAYASQIVGVTGTKGKSTTASLIYHILKSAGRDVILAGNIGNPVFHIAGMVDRSTTVVVELSSHQLEFLSRSPHIAVFLNLFQEHLDAYESFEHYQLAKVNITRFQEQVDFLVYHACDPLIREKIQPYLASRIAVPFSLTGRLECGAMVKDGEVWFAIDHPMAPVWKVHQDRFLRGEHNLKNILAAVCVAKILEVDNESLEEGIGTFKGLEHRLEFVGEYRGINFYNDSIATIPEACMEAVKAIPLVDTLVAGGFDRGIDYHDLAVFLCKSQVRNLILTGDAGKRIGKEIEGLGCTDKQLFYIRRFDDFAPIAFRETRPGQVCLLSPAAASYDEFSNFEERGKRYRMLVKEEQVQC